MQIKLSTDDPLKKSSTIVSGILALITAFGPAIIESWSLLPDSMRDALPSGVAQVIAVVAFLLVIAARCTVIVR